MSLIKCGECGKEISDQAPSCIGCGAPVAVKPVYVQAPTGTSVGKVLMWLAIVFIGGPVLLFFGSAFIAGTMEAFSDSGAHTRKSYTGKLRIDSGTEYELLNYASNIGGECAGWNTVSLQKPGDRSSSITNLMCWREVGNRIEVNTKTGQWRRSDPKANFVD